MSFPEYIRKHTPQKCAKLFNVKERTAFSWMRRERYPTPTKAHEIVAAAKGEVTMQDIYGQPLDPFYNQNAAKRNAAKEEALAQFRAAAQL
jgi:DNA-binding transcriptional regulator YdaS (Cro superfamily)